MGKTDEAKENYLYLTRESFCLADDCMAPNLKKYEWTDKDRCPVVDFYYVIEQYLGPNLPGFAWRGFVTGKNMKESKKIVDVIIHRDELSFSREIALTKNWKELLHENSYIHFVNAKTKDELPEKLAIFFD